MRVGLRSVSFLMVAILWIQQSGGAADAAPPVKEFRFRRDFVLGTSMDLVVRAADEMDAQAAERLILVEIDRLAAILSTYESGSEISRLNGTHSPVTCSPELIEVLNACESWRTLSGGAFNVQAAQIIDAWKQAEKTGQAPPEPALAALARRIEGKAWEVQPGLKTARRLGQGRVTVDALAKGYIVDKAMAAARRHAGGVSGILLDIGGDIASWRAGSAASEGTPWQIDIADPRHPQENAPPLATVRLSDSAIATSGNYARYFQVGGRRYSHIVDPRSGRPADHIASATVVAANCATADALATILSVLTPPQSLALLGSLRRDGVSAECLIVDRDGKQWISPGWQQLQVPRTGPLLASDAGGWQNELLIRLSIMRQTGRKVHRPFVACWIEDAKGKPVRTLSVWGREAKYFKELSSWWSFARGDQKLVQAVSRASRSPGQYELAWDGRDDAGQALPQGTYTVRVESAREKGRHVNLSGRIACEGSPATAKIEGNSEIGEIVLTYGPREKKP